VQVQQVLQGAFKGAHDLLDSVMADVDKAHLSKLPPGANIQTIQAIYAHILIGEDLIVNRLVRQQQPAITAEALKGTGVPLPATPQLNPEWSASIDMDLPRFREFAKSFFASSEAAIGAMTDAQLAAEVNGGPFGTMPASGFLANLALYHVVGHTGEIAALKGIHGLKGLPF
jgi:hypothetical protein